MKTIKKFKKAFTMLELVFVIAILGIVASISSSVIVQVYEAYIMQRATHNASIDTELAINQITNRLTYRINNSLLARKPGQTGITDADALPIDELNTAQLNTYTGLEWINYDHDSFSGYNPPAWSGLCDLNTSTFDYIDTPGSDLSKLNTGSYALVFLGRPDYRIGGHSYSIRRCMYHDDGCIFPVSSSSATRLTFETGSSRGDRVANEMIYTEFYQLAQTAYAVVPQRDASVGIAGTHGGSMLNGIEVWDLHLYANYQPWDNENYTNGTDDILIKDISVFRFKKEANSIRVKLCKVVPVGDISQITICKEKAVIR